MTLEILTIPCLSDNYAFLAHDPETGTTALIDAPEAAPIEVILSAKGWNLDIVLLTHHHFDHVEGLPELRERYNPVVIGAKADAHRLPPLDIEVAEGDTVRIGSENGTVIDVSGHTVGHVAFYFAGSKAVFTADSLMALGCGRVFEGTFPMMWESLSKLAALPTDTTVYSGHEYTQSNGRFAATIEPDNPDLAARIADITEARDSNLATVPSLLSLELATNPFLRASQPSVKAALGMEDASDAEVFAEIRSRKDKF